MSRESGVEGIPAQPAGIQPAQRRRLRGRAGAADHRGRAPSGAEVLPHGDLRGADRGRERPGREVRLPGAPAGRGRRGRGAADGPGVRHRRRGLGVRGAGRLRGHVAGRAGGDIRPAPIRRGLSSQRLVHHRPRPADSHLLPSAGSVRLRPIHTEPWQQALAWLVGSALWIAYTFIMWLARGRVTEPQPVAEIPGISRRGR